ncbi:MAG: orotidine-5'-phosphate decarboxylase, partial [Polyangiaceae bacterium]|nr:orotidine-5'-phosphate decarboxylase [Polyangiaceae bacterium]
MELALAKKKVAFALDYPELELARRGAEAVGPEVGVLKVGLELFIQAGPAAVKMAQETGAEVFLDLKLHDISKTVERAVLTACEFGCDYLTLHAGGGPGMLEAASEAVARTGAKLCLLGVTVLTSLDESDLESVGVHEAPAQQAERLARLAKNCGLGGLLCSTQEVGRLRQV